MSDTKGDEPGEHDPVEIEWQFDALDLRPVERWLATLPTLAVETGDGGTVTALARTPRRLVDSYLDTDDWRIARAGFVVRTRRRGRNDEVTLKDTRPAEGSGLRQRLEVTEVLPASGLAALGPDGPVGRRLRAIVGTRRLHEVLQVRTRRRPFALRVGGVDAAEVALDDTMIVVGSGQRPMQLRRVEVEVHPEWLDALEPIVDQLRASCGLQPARLSKFEAGLLALGEEIPGSPDLGPTDVSATSTMGELAFAVLRRQLAVVRDKEPGTRLGEDVEELHDMRVATRRLRAALSLFESVLPVRAQLFREELGWMGRLLGAVRDLDVQRQGLAEMAAQGAGVIAGIDTTGHDPLADLAALLERERQAARTELLNGLDSVRWDRLVKGLTAMAQQGPARRSLATRVPAEIGMPELVLARHGKVDQGGAGRQAVRRGVGLPPRAHPVQAAALRARVQCRRVRGSHLPLRARAHGPAGRARRDAGRRGGVAPAGRPRHRGDPPARCHDLRDGRRGRTAPARREAVPQAPARRAAPHPREGVARAARPHGAPPCRGRGRTATCPHRATRPAAATPRGRAGAGAPSDGRARPGTSRRGSGADGAGAAAAVRPGGMTPRRRP